MPALKGRFATKTLRDERLKELFNEGMTYDLIALDLDIAVQTVQHDLKRLGLRRISDARAQKYINNGGFRLPKEKVEDRKVPVQTPVAKSDWMRSLTRAELMRGK